MLGQDLYETFANNAKDSHAIHLDVLLKSWVACEKMGGRKVA
jgi:hypothetical protein